MMARALFAAMACLLATPAAAADPVEIPAFMRIPRPTPDLEIRYGAAPAQAIDVFRPPGRGPFPVAILIHGGCWSATTDGRAQLRHLGADLARRGIAVWSIGYRRANEPGGGYPGTFLDVAAAIDRLPAEAGRFDLDLSRTVVVGHSAGGHLALWAAARRGLPRESPLYAPEAFLPGQVISLAGIPDLKSFGRYVPMHCGPGIYESLAPLEKLAEVSPAALPAPAARVVLVSGIVDRLVPPFVAHEYARARRDQPGLPIRVVDLPDAGHFDLVTATTPAWSRIRGLIVDALSRKTAARR